jgi:AAA domain
MELPSITPAERFQPALNDALAARANAAGGAEHIISGDDVDKVIADVMGEDDRAVAAARQQCTQLRRDLERAELTTAAAFAAAEIRSAEHVAAQLDELDTELRVLDAASRYQPLRPLPIAPSAVTNLDPADAAALTGTAALPFAVTVLHAAPSDERTAALRVLHDATIAANRNVLWCSPTQEQAASAVADRVATTAATVADTHAEILSGQGALAPGTLIVVDHAADADPAVLADLAERAAANQSGLILLDTTGPTWPPQPSRQLLGLLHTELPWTATLSAHPSSEVITRGTPPDLDPALTQSRRLHPSLRDDHLNDSLTRADQLHAKIEAAYKRHLDATWLRQRGPSAEQQTPHLGLSDD